VGAKFFPHLVLQQTALVILDECSDSLYAIDQRFIDRAVKTLLNSEPHHTAQYDERHGKRPGIPKRQPGADGMQIHGGGASRKE
jgi:hypothetical protein